VEQSGEQFRVSCSILEAEAPFQEEEEVHAGAQHIPEDLDDDRSHPTDKHRVRFPGFVSCSYRVMKPTQSPFPLPEDMHGNDIPSAQGLWDAIQKCDDDMCKGLKEDYIDTLLVFVS
jgi:hypothetical protein